MHLELKRHDNNATRCLGTLSIDGAYYCVTLEDTVRLPGVKVQDKTAIPRTPPREYIAWRGEDYIVYRAMRSDSC